MRFTFFRPSDIGEAVHTVYSFPGRLGEKHEDRRLA